MQIPKASFVFLSKLTLSFIIFCGLFIIILQLLIVIPSNQYQYIYTINVKNALKSELELLKEELFDEIGNKQLDSLTLDSHYDSVDTIGQEFNFDEDVLVQIHIQKTSGQTWETHIFENLYIRRDRSLKLEKLCKLKENSTLFYDCLNNTYGKSIVWNRNFHYSTCDYHADYTETFNCFMHEYESRVSKEFIQKYKGIGHFITIIRDPIKRYISEFKHLKIGIF